MKKSLILSVVMTLVLVISMSTATYAWYQSNSTVTTAATTVTAAAEGSADIAFKWSDSDSATSGKTPIQETYTEFADSVQANTQPMIVALEAAPVAGTTTFSQFTLTTAKLRAGVPSVTPTEDGNKYYFKAPSVATKYQAVKKTDEAYDKLEIVNLGDSATGDLTVTAAITGANADLLRIAIFAGGNYLGTLATSATAKTYFADSTLFGTNKGQEEFAAGATNYMPTLAGTGLTINSIAAHDATEFQYVAWFDGVALARANAGQAASFKLTIAAPVA